MRQANCIAVLLLTMLITGCGVPSSFIITNKSPIPVSVTVEIEQGTAWLLSLSPGEKRSFYTVDDSTYLVAAAPNNEWRETVMVARDFLSEKWRNKASLTPAEIVDLQRRLDSIDNKIKAQASLSRCKCEMVTDERECSIVADDLVDYFADIQQLGDGTLNCTCGTVGLDKK